MNARVYVPCSASRFPLILTTQRVLMQPTVGAQMRRVQNANVVIAENSKSADQLVGVRGNAVEVVLVNQKDAWQKRAREERSLPTRDRKRSRGRATA